MSSGSRSEQFWLDHVRAWEASEQKRRDYCREQGLSERSFDYWVQRLRSRIGLPQRQVTGRAEGGTGRFMPVVVSEAVPDLKRAGGGLVDLKPRWQELSGWPCSFCLVFRRVAGQAEIFV
jgi:hypothetical protein